MPGVSKPDPAAATAVLQLWPPLESPDAGVQHRMCAVSTAKKEDQLVTHFPGYATGKVQRDMAAA